MKYRGVGKMSLKVYTVGSYAEVLRFINTKYPSYNEHHQQRQPILAEPIFIEPIKPNAFEYEPIKPLPFPEEM